ncbi:MAG: hypothetical protein GEU90_04980 [Gemmatimonas sp.]|nr:hypothetical protein [Gemmatimonas sp.]
MLIAVAVVALLQTPQSAPEIPSDAYLDEDAAMMVAAARVRTSGANERIEAYRMTARQRFSVGVRGLRRDRMIYRREIATRVDWRRGGDRQLEVLGAREASEVAGLATSPLDDDDLLSDADMAIDPTSEWLLRFPLPDEDDEDDDGRGNADEQTEDEDSDDDITIMHPLAEGSERHYRFRSGETTSIILGDGRTIRLRELQVLPRRATYSLVSGSLWLEAESFAAVRGIFTLAAPLRFSDIVSDGEDVTIGPGRSIIDLASASLGYLTIEYGLWDSTWWLPRLVALEGRVNVGRFEVPLVYEQLYEDYRVFADPDSVPAFEPIDTTQFRRVRRRCRGDDDCPERWVLIPKDSSLLVSSAALPGSMFGTDRWMTDTELEQVENLVRISGWRSMAFQLPHLEWRPLDAGLIHFNRVEGLTLGTSVNVDLQPLSLYSGVWIGHADPSPSFRLDLSRNRPGGRETIGAYRRVEAFTPDDRPFSIASSISSFAFGADDGDYYRSLGVSVTSETTTASRSGLRMRFYAERQEPLEKQTDASVRAWFGDHTFRPNPPADPADQLGVDVRANFAYGSNARAFRGGVEARLRAERGTFRFAQPSLAAYTTVPLPGPLMLGLDAAAGTSFGEVPVQSLWYLGGPSTIRAFRPEDRTAGQAFWRTRAEVGSDFVGARLALFSDLGWAGERDAFTADPALISAGVGASFLDGLVRADLARTVRGAPGRWGLHVYLDAIF